MNPTIKELLDSFERMTPEELREARLLLQERFGFGGPEGSDTGTREPKTPLPPVLILAGEAFCCDDDCHNAGWDCHEGKTESKEKP